MALAVGAEEEASWQKEKIRGLYGFLPLRGWPFRGSLLGALVNASAAVASSRLVLEQPARGQAGQPTAGPLCHRPCLEARFPLGPGTLSQDFPLQK